MSKNREEIISVVRGTFLDRIKSSFKENLLSVLLYGSAASGDFIPGVSDVNVLIILNEIDKEQIEKFGRENFRSMNRHRITPLILTRTEFQNSADVFPMEYFDIQEQNSVLFGEDETKMLKLERKNLRHQLEERLRGCLNSIRQMIIASRGRKRYLRMNLRILFGSFKSLFRGLLRLRGISSIPNQWEEILELLHGNFGVDVKPFMEINKLRGGEKIDPLKLSVELSNSLEKLTGVVDRMKT
ncbi:MAG: nucleotidyltransferase domain-containing protein [Spirochaetota bacterium]